MEVCEYIRIVDEMEVDVDPSTTVIGKVLVFEGPLVVGEIGIR